MVQSKVGGVRMVVVDTLLSVDSRAWRTDGHIAMRRVHGNGSFRCALMAAELLPAPAAVRS